MKLLLTAAAAAALLESASAHYIFSKLIVGGKATDEYEYVRKNTNMNSPLTDVTSTDFRCNTGSQGAAASTKTYTVAAGDEVGMAVGMGGSIIHPGPLLVYLSKAPAGQTAASYDGSGDWFKIHELGTSAINSSGMFWETTGGTQFTWKLPANTPPGDYLMRTEHIALHQAQQAGGAQFYMECAQLTVTGGDANGKPGPTAKIPGVYKATDPGVEINIYYPVPQSYDFPGPAVWPAGADASAGSTGTGSSSKSNNAGTSTGTSTGKNGGTGVTAVASGPTAVAIASSGPDGTSSFSSGNNAGGNSGYGSPAPPAPASGTSGTTGSTGSTGGSGGSGKPGNAGTSTGASSGKNGGTGVTVVASGPTAVAIASSGPDGTSSFSSGNNAGGSSGSSFPPAPAPAAGTTGGTAALYGQCGGQNWKGPTACAAGATCKVQNPYYSQCLAGAGKRDGQSGFVTVVVPEEPVETDTPEFGIFDM